MGPPSKASPSTKSTSSVVPPSLCHEGVDSDALDRAMHTLVHDAADMRERGPGDTHARISRVLNDRRFRRSLSNAKNNRLGANVDRVVSGILRHLELGSCHGADAAFADAAATFRAFREERVAEQLGAA